MPLKLIGILAGIALVLLIVVVFWLAGQADSKPPMVTRVIQPATNVGPQSSTPAPVATPAKPN